MYDNIKCTFMGELDDTLRDVLKSLVHSIILVKHKGFILGCEKWDRHVFTVLFKTS